MGAAKEYRMRQFNRRQFDKPVVLSAVRESAYVKPETKKPQSVTRRQGVSWMRLNVEDFVEYEEVNLTLLAEGCAHHFNHDDWLDDETHWIHDIAVQVAIEYESE